MNTSNNVWGHEDSLENRKQLTIWKYTVDIPVLWGGMGIGITMAPLSGNIALNGWIGTLSATAIHKTPYYKDLLTHNLETARKLAWGHLSEEQRDACFLETQVECIKKEVKRAKEIANGNGAIFINIMVATSHYKEQVLAACEAGVDGIVSGAWLPRNLLEITKDYPDVAIIPILSTVKGVDVFLKLCEKTGRYPDAIVLEDPSTAWGHLGAASLEKVDDDSGKLEISIPAVRALLKSKNLNIPIIGAGGVVDKEDMDRVMALWADGVQVGTRFLASVESGANQEFKEAVVNATPDDIITYMSSAWLPARALKASGTFPRIEDVVSKQRKCIELCLNHCWFVEWNPNLAQMCINKELVRSTEWWRWDGLMFVWSSASRIKSILTVKEIMDNFKWNEA